MAIQRSGPTPNFYEYICSFLLVPSKAPSGALMNLVVPGQQTNWVDIPSFQRGISWEIEEVKELLQSSSILLGNAILSQFQVNQSQFPFLPNGTSVYLTLVDGLQRFAVGTAILSVLHDDVLAPHANRPADAVHFAALAARVSPLSPYYDHNNRELIDHSRKAIKDQYAVLRSAISTYIKEEFDTGRAYDLSQKVVPLFLTRQVALDIYFNFSRQQLLSTFIGINTVRLDLGPVDLLRANILEMATISGWSQSEMESLENDFTDTLTNNGQTPKQEYIPFINAALKTIVDGKGVRLFKSWGNALKKQDVDNFLDFVDRFEASANPYLDEILACGKLPTSLVFGYYYMDFLHGSKSYPDFFSVGNVGSDADLHAFLITCYRLLMAGSVGRTTDFLEQIINGALSVALYKLADAISIKFIAAALSTQLDKNWLETQLSTVDKKTAQRMFNAMLLPVKGALGSKFKPLKFGRASTEFHVDHLIPDSLLDSSKPGGVQGQTLRNFAPLPSNQNRAAKATNCSTKLSPGGIYATYVSGASGHAVHPYCLWILSTAILNIALDNQSNLERNSNPDVGTQRISEIASQLILRL
jgi:hypothetical protein